MISRRTFLGHAGVLASSPWWWPRRLQASSSRVRRTLIVLHLDGGNDGLATVIPTTNATLRAARPRLAAPSESHLHLDEERAFPSSLTRWKKAWDEGDLAIVEGVGYPDPSRSHFESTAIWHSAARTPKSVRGGWIGRALENRGESALYVGQDAIPLALHGRASAPTQIESIDDLLLTHSPVTTPDSDDPLLQAIAARQRTAHRLAERLRHRPAPPSTIQPSPLARSLGLVHLLLDEGLAPPILFLRHTGYDTHRDQAGRHAELLLDLSNSVSDFFEDLGDRARDVTMLVFSEFGRTLAENDSRGTDHGTAGPVFVYGPSVNGGCYGRPSDLTHLVDGEPVPTTDFRSVYASVLESWLEIDARPATGREWPSLRLFG